jgi:hypothetical protein
MDSEVVPKHIMICDHQRTATLCIEESTLHKRQRPLSTTLKKLCKETENDQTIRIKLKCHQNCTFEFIFSKLLALMRTPCTIIHITQCFTACSDTYALPREIHKRACRKRSLRSFGESRAEPEFHEYIFRFRSSFQACLQYACSEACDVDIHPRQQRCSRSPPSQELYISMTRNRWFQIRPRKGGELRGDFTQVGNRSSGRP